MSQFHSGDKESVAEKLTQQAASRTASARRQKRILYLITGFFGVLLVGYFVRQFHVLFAQPSSGMVAPPRAERLDTALSKQVALTQLYDQEEKNRRKDSIQILEEEQALNYISMDWQNLYDVKKKMMKEETEKQAAQSDSLSILAGILSRRDSIPKIRAKKQQIQLVKAGTGKKKAGKIAKRDREKQAAQARPALHDPFNTVREGINSPLSSHAEIAPGMRAAYAGNTSGLMQGDSSLPIAERAIIVPAVVHGNHKVQNGSKVTFRTLEEATLNGTLLPKNTLIAGIAQIGGGRLSFSNFRTRLGNSGITLPFHCYDSDLMAGISYQDQGIVETEVRKNTANALTDATASLSYAIPYGSLARASSDIARGIIRGSARKRETFIHLSDGYKVHLALQTKK